MACTATIQTTTHSRPRLGRIQTTPIASMQNKPTLTKWGGKDLISLLPNDIYLVDRNTKVKTDRIPASGYELKVDCRSVPIPGKENEPFVRLSCGLPDIDFSAVEDTVYLIPPETLGILLLGYTMRDLKMPRCFIIPIGEEKDCTGCVTGYDDLASLDRLADAPEGQAPETFRAALAG